MKNALGDPIKADSTGVAVLESISTIASKVLKLQSKAVVESFVGFCVSLRTEYNFIIIDRLSVNKLWLLLRDDKPHILDILFRITAEYQFLYASDVNHINENLTIALGAFRSPNKHKLIDDVYINSFVDSRELREYFVDIPWLPVAVMLGFIDPFKFRSLGIDEPQAGDVDG